MKKGINVVTMPQSLSIEEQINLAEKAGYQTIEFNVAETHQKELDLSLDTTKEELELIAQLIEKSTLKIESVSTVLHWRFPLSSPDEKIREKGIEVAKKMIDFAAFFKADTILVVPGVVTPEVDYASCYERSKKCLEVIAAYGQEKNISVGIENVENRFLQSPIEAKRFIDEINQPNVGFYLDIGNVIPVGYPEHWIPILDQRILKVHVKDYTKHGSCQLLAGDVNWKSVMTELKKIGYSGPLTCEVSPYKNFGEQLTYDTSKAIDRLLGY